MHVSDSYAGSPSPFPLLWPNKLSQAINVSAVPNRDSRERERAKAESKAKDRSRTKAKKIHTGEIPLKRFHWNILLSRATASLSHEKWFLSFFSFIIKNRKWKRKKFQIVFSSFLISRHSRRAGAIEKLLSEARHPLPPARSTVSPIRQLPRCL